MRTIKNLSDTELFEFADIVEPFLADISESSEEKAAFQELSNEIRQHMIDKKDLNGTEIAAELNLKALFVMADVQNKLKMQIGANLRKSKDFREMAVQCVKIFGGNGDNFLGCFESIILDNEVRNFFGLSPLSA